MPDPSVSGLLEPRGIHLHERAADREEAVRRCGRALLEIGAVTGAYLDRMLEREATLSTYVGEGVAIPHGTAAGKDEVLRDALAVVRFPDGVGWGGGDTVTLCVAIAARGNRHVDILGALAGVLLDPGQAARLREATDPDDVIRLLTAEESPT